MKTRILATAAAVAIGSSSSQVMANAANEIYLGLQYEYGFYSQDVAGCPDLLSVPDYNVGAITARFGAFGTANLAIEGRAGFGIQDDTQTVDTTDGSADVKLELENLLGMYAVGHLNFGRNSSVYGVLGFTRIEAKVSAPAVPGLALSDDDSDFSYGVGVGLGISKSIAVNIEYMSYYTKDAVDLNAAAIGLVFGF